MATIGGTPLTVESLQKKLDEQSPFVRARYAEPGKKKEFVDGQVRFEVLAKEAKERGYEDDPEVEEAIKKIIVQRLTREEFDGRVQLKDVTDADLRAYFDEHKADYQKPEMARASVITISYDDGKLTQAQAKAKAQEVFKKAQAGKGDDRVLFKQLVEETSTDPVTKAAGGDVRYLDKTEFTSRFDSVIAEWLFSAEELGPVHEPVDVARTKQFVIVKRTGRRKAIERDFDAVKNQIKNVVYREKRSKEFNVFVDSLKQKHKVVVHEDKIEKLRVDQNAPATGFDPHAGHGHGMPDGVPDGDAHGAP